MSRAIIITGATGKQGGALINALLSTANAGKDFLLLPVTRDATSASAKRLAARASNIKVIQGDLTDTPALFSAAKTAAGSIPLWGVFSVQVVSFSDNSEVVQGNALTDEALKYGIKQFVYTSAERGGNEKSWDNPTNVPHIITKHKIEHHLRDEAAKQGGNMKWTILRPVAFMDNLEPNFYTKVFMTAMHSAVPETKPVAWVDTKDIGFFAAQAFTQPEKWENRAFAIAAENLNWAELNAVFKRATGQGVPTTFGLFGTALMYGVKEMGIMLKWFGTGGFGPNIVEESKQVNPNMTSMEEYLKRVFVKA